VSAQRVPSVRLAVLACLAVECTYRNVLEIERHAIAEQKHLGERHKERDHQAAGVTPDLQELLEGDGFEPAEPHAAFLGAATSAAISCTNTSSSDGGIRAMWLGRSPFAARKSGSSERLFSALPTRTCSALPKTEQSRTSGAFCSASSVWPSAS